MDQLTQREPHAAQDNTSAASVPPVERCDVLVAGAGVGGLLIASALAPHCSVLLVEQQPIVPRAKYWLTDEAAARAAPELASAVERRSSTLDYTAYDGLTARVPGEYCLWNTDVLIDMLLAELAASDVRVRTGQRVYSVYDDANGVTVRAGASRISARLVVDCMGIGSPIVAAKGTVAIDGYYFVHGVEVPLVGDPSPIGLENVVMGDKLGYFELFPTARGTAAAALIVPSRTWRTDHPIKADLNFILRESHHAHDIGPGPFTGSYFGIIPVGRLRANALDRIVFFGESGQANPAASATTLSRLLRTRDATADAILAALRSGNVSADQLQRSLPDSMSRLHRAFHLELFRSILDYSSDDFRRLVKELASYPPEIVNGLIFADLDFRPRLTAGLLLDAIRRPRGVLGRHLLAATRRYVSR